MVFLALSVLATLVEHVLMRTQKGCEGLSP